MSIEQRLPQDEINIKDLHIEEPEATPELPFDPEKEITEEDWKNIAKRLEEYKQRGRWSDYLWRARESKILNPEFNVTLQDQDKKNLLAFVKQHSASLEPQIYSNFKILFPKIPFEITAEEWQEMKKQLNSYQTANGWNSFLYLAESMALLDPHLAWNLENEEKQKLLNILKQLKNRENWSFFLSMHARTKLLFSDIEVPLNDKDWHKIRDYLHEKKENLPDFTFYAAYAKILAAEKVEITDHGLEITMPKPKADLNQPTPPMPEVKKF